jgi:hypothetical protein
MPIPQDEEFNFWKSLTCNVSTWVDIVIKLKFYTYSRLQVCKVQIRSKSRERKQERPYGVVQLSENAVSFHFYP